MISRSLLAGAALIAVLSAGFAFADDKPLTFSTNTAYPESFTWSASQNEFLVGSVTHGTIGTVSATGAYAPWIKDDKLVSSIGLFADDQRNTLWVANSDPGAGDRTNAVTQGKLAGVARYDLTTGKPIAYYDLGSLSEGSHFANDIALDAAGNAYVTDSFAPLVYKIDTAGKASIFAKSPLFHDGDGFNLNGIAYLSDGYLLVGKYNSGDLFRISLADPTDIEKVKLPKPILGADGFNLVDEQHLVIALNLGVDTTVELTSTDGWKSADYGKELKSAASMPTAVTRAGDALFVLNSRLDTLFDPKAEKVGDYVIQKF